MFEHLVVHGYLETYEMLNKISDSGDQQIANARDEFCYGLIWLTSLFWTKMSSARGGYRAADGLQLAYGFPVTTTKMLKNSCSDKQTTEFLPAPSVGRGAAFLDTLVQRMESCQTDVYVVRVSVNYYLA